MFNNLTAAAIRRDDPYFQVFMLCDVDCWQLEGKYYLLHDQYYREFKVLYT